MKGIVFIKNTVILTATSFLLRVAGMFFKIWMAGNVGAEGVGLYSQVTSVYMFAATFASSGLCTGVTKLLAEQKELGKRAVSVVLRRATVLTLAAAFLIGGAIFLLAPFISERLLCDERAALALKMIGFALPFKGTSACIKGYFYAERKTGHASVSQLLEQAVRIGAVMLLVTRFGRFGIAAKTAAILAGDAISEASSFIYLYFTYKKDRAALGTLGTRPKNILKNILSVALPITGSKYITTGLHTLESMIVPAQLALYTLSKSEALAQFGSLKGMALPLVFFPASFLSALSVMMITEMSESAARRQFTRIRGLVDKTVSTTVIISVAVAGAFFAVADPIARLTFGSETVGYMIKFLAPIIPFMYLESVADGMLKGLDQQKHFLKYNIIDSAVRIMLIFLLLRRLGILGFLIIMIISNVFTSSMNTGRLIFVAGSRVRVADWIIKPIVSIFAGVFAAEGIQKILPQNDLLITVVCSCAVVAVYFAMMVFLGGIKIDRFLPVKKQKTGIICE